MRVVFMGTPDFAVPCLKALINEKNHEVLGVFTQPDRRRGRGKKMQGTPIKILAKEEKIPVYQPEKLNTSENYQILKDMKADVFVVVAYGQILSKKILDIPPFGAINVHASLLPKYRGAAPIHWAVIHGEEETGITTMQMDQGLDTGDMLLQKSVEIGAEDTTGDLHDRLALLGPRVLLETLEGLEKEEITPIPQELNKGSYAPKITKELAKISWDSSAKDIYNLIRGLNPYPGAQTSYRGKSVKVHEARWIQEDSGKEPGTILEVGKAGILVATGKGQILIKEIQFSGKKRMKVAEYLAGNTLEENTKLGETDE